MEFAFGMGCCLAVFGESTTEKLIDMDSFGDVFWKSFIIWVCLNDSLMKVRVLNFFGGMGVLIATIFLALYVYLLVWGLPEGVQKLVLKELEDRGLVVGVDGLKLDLSGGIDARGLRLYKHRMSEDRWLEIDRAYIDVGWLAWLRGRSLLKKASVINAKIFVPVGRQILRLSEVNASVEFWEDRMEVQYASAQFLNVMLQFQGGVWLDGTPEGLPEMKISGEADLESLPEEEAPWERVIRWMEEVKTSPFCKVDVQFELSTRNPKDARVVFSISGQKFRWRETMVEHLHGIGSYRNRLLSLDVLEADFERGGMMLSAKVDGRKREFVCKLSSDVDLSLFAQSAKGPWGEVARRVVFNELPLLEMTVRGNWKDREVNYNLQLDVDWRNFSYNEIKCKRLFLPVGFDGNRWLVPEGLVETEHGQLKMDFLSSHDPLVVKGKAYSTINPRILVGTGGKALDRFLESLAFKNKGPEVDLKISGKGLKDGEYKIDGSAGGEDFLYKGVEIKRVSGDFSYEGGVLMVPRLLVEREEGALSGALIHDFKRRRVTLRKLQSTLNVSEVAPALGSKFVSYVSPYRFHRRPALAIDGVVDLADEKKKLDTDLVVDVNADSTMAYDLLGKTFHFEAPQGQVRIRDRSLFLDLRGAGMYGGRLQGNFSSELLPVEHPPFHTVLSLTNANVNDAFTHLFNYKECSGKLDVKVEIRGGIGNQLSFVGEGNIAMRGGYILSIPFLGGLSSILGTLIPSFGFAKADRAVADFKIGKGAVSTENLTISSALFTLIGNGEYEFVKDNLNLDMRANMKGVAGLLLFPVSKIFEYNGSGPLSNPVWKPKLTE
jgi:hypothetical protein